MCVSVTDDLPPASLDKTSIGGPYARQGGLPSCLLLPQDDSRYWLRLLSLPFQYVHVHLDQFIAHDFNNISPSF